jgi:hypothetical protein
MSRRTRVGRGAGDPIIDNMHLREAFSLAAAASVVAVVSFTPLGCASGAARRAQLGSDNPLDRATAIVEVYDARDRKAVQKLVDLLDDSSSAVRLYAILALRGLTGEDLGYRYYESEVVRAASVRRWRDAVRAGIVVLGAATPAIPPGAAAPRPPDSTAADATGSQ